MNKARRILMLVLALVLTLSATTGALATSTDMGKNKPVSTTGGQNDTAVNMNDTKISKTIYKSFITTEDAQIPTVSFTFDLIPISETGTVLMDNLVKADVSFSEADRTSSDESITHKGNTSLSGTDHDVTLTAGQYVVQKKLTFDVGASVTGNKEGFVFTKPGYYRFIIREELPTNAVSLASATDPDNTKYTLNGVEYEGGEKILEVLVGHLNDPNADPNAELINQLSVLATNVYVRTDKKRVYTDAAADHAALANPFAMYSNNATDKNNLAFPNQYLTYPLVVSKKVTGTLGNTDETFLFKVHIGTAGDAFFNADDGTTTPASTNYPLVLNYYDSTDTKTTTKANPTSTAWWDRKDNSYTITTDDDILNPDSPIIPDTDYYISLKNGESFEILGLPQGSSYTVLEVASDVDLKSYTTKVASVTDSLADEPTVAEAVTEPETGIAGTINAGNEENYTNDKDTPTPTGIILTVLPYALMLALAGVGLMLVLSKKRRENEE